MPRWHRSPAAVVPLPCAQPAHDLFAPTTGAEDELVPAVYSSLMTDAVRACGGDAELTLLPGMGHNEGIEYAYEHTDVTEWLISMRRTDHTPVPEFLSEYF